MFVVVLSESEGDGRRRIQLRYTTGVTVPRGDGQLWVQVTSLNYSSSMSIRDITMACCYWQWREL